MRIGVFVIVGVFGRVGVDRVREVGAAAGTTANQAGFVAEEEARATAAGGAGGSWWAGLEAQSRKFRVAYGLREWKRWWSDCSGYWRMGDALLCLGVWIIRDCEDGRPNTAGDFERPRGLLIRARELNIPDLNSRRRYCIFG